MNRDSKLHSHPVVYPVSLLLLFLIGYTTMVYSTGMSSVGIAAGASLVITSRFIQ